MYYIIATMFKLYQPVFKTEKNLFKLTQKMFKEVFSARELIWRLFLRDFSAKYKQSILGLAWIFILPLVAVGTFVVLNISGVFKTEGLTVPYINQI